MGKDENATPGNSVTSEAYRERDRTHWRKLEALIRDHEISFSELLINFPAFIRRRELPRILSDYELFKKIVDLPGSIAELGVYLGAGFFNWSNLLETFVPGDRSRKVYGFDSGEGYSRISDKDGDPNPWIERVVGEKKVAAEFLDKLVELHNADNLLPGVERCRFIAGDIGETVPEFTKNLQGIRFSLLYFDVNLYEPTLVGLEHLYPQVLSGGIVAFNGYGAAPWEGEARAIEDYFISREGKVPVMEKFPFSIYPSGYFFKK